MDIVVVVVMQKPQFHVNWTLVTYLPLC